MVAGSADGSTWIIGRAGSNQAPPEKGTSPMAARPTPQPAEPVTAQDLIDDLDQHTGQMPRERWAVLHPDGGYKAATILAENIRNEAIRRDWCGEYDDWAAGVNAEVGFILLTPRTANYRLAIDVTVAANVPRQDIEDAIERHLFERWQAETIVSLR